MQTRKLSFGVVTTFPPGSGSLNEYAYHFVRALRRKAEVQEVLLFVDELPAALHYNATITDVPLPETTPGSAQEAVPGHEQASPTAEAGPQQNELAPVHFIPCWRFNGISNVLRILRAVRRTKADVVLFNIQFATFGDRKLAAALGLLAPALLRLFGVPTVVLLHNIMETVDLKNAGFADKPLLERLIRFFGTVITHLLLRANLVAVTIPKYVEILEERYGAKNVLLAPHGAFESAALEPSYNLPAGPQQIMTFGKFGTYKRVETLVEAFSLLQTRRASALELVIAGTDSPNAPHYLANVAQQYAAVPNVRYTGYVAEEDVPIIFGQAAAVVFPYTSTTGSSGVLHQAGDYGKAVVLPKIGDLAELIAEEGYTGEFFEPGDAQSLADAIALILDHPDRRIEMGRQNYLAARGLPLADVLDWYLLHIETVLNNRKS